MKDATRSEYAVIGALCLDPGIIAELGAALSAADFTLKPCAEVYDAVLRGEVIDAPSAANLLAPTMGSGQAAEFIRSCMDEAPSVHNAGYHAEAVHSAAQDRHLRRALSEELSREGDELAERVIGIARESISDSIRSSKTLPEALADMCRNLRQDNSARLDMGFPALDALLKGLYPGKLVILGARPAVGKSAFALALALHTAQNAGKTLLFSMEMNAQEIARRCVTTRGTITMDEMMDDVSDELVGRIVEVAGPLSKVGPIIIDDTPALSIDRLRARVRLHPDAKLVIVDYLGLMQTKRRDGNRNLELGELCRELKIFAAEAGVPIVALSQLNRGVSDSERPTLRSLRDSGELEQHADKVMLMWRAPNGLIAVDVAKNRAGRTGVVHFLFDGDHMSFREAAVRYVEPKDKKKKKPNVLAPGA